METQICCRCLKENDLREFKVKNNGKHATGCMEKETNAFTEGENQGVENAAERRFAYTVEKNHSVENVADRLFVRTEGENQLVAIVEVRLKLP